MADHQEAEARKTHPLMTRVGTSGLRNFSGYIREEFHRDLVGRRGREVFHEMASNDSTAGAIIFAITMLLRSAAWTFMPSDPHNPDSVDAAKLVEGMLTQDMQQSFPDVVDSACSMFVYGFTVCEVLWKKRNGRNVQKPWLSSDFDDGMWAPRAIASRSQRTIERWVYDDDENLLGFVQMPHNGPMVVVPISRCLHFRTTSELDNPEGRALDPMTPIPTPDGWRRMDDLDVGDKVFDERGRICYVTARQDWEGRPCHEIEFSDGERIVADDNHQWLTASHYERNQKQHSVGLKNPSRRQSVKTTAEIARNLVGPTGAASHSIPLAGPLDYPKQHLPICPYVFGYWLGDGNSANAEITTHAEDVEHLVAEMEGAGLSAGVVHNSAVGGQGSLIRFQSLEGPRAAGNPASLLRALGVHNNKHIPLAYMHGSFAQRLALLQGLMDSDGTVDSMGRCTFTSSNPALAEGAAELIRSLGSAATIYEKPAREQVMPNGKVSQVKPSMQVRFKPIGFTPFRLPRKVARCDHRNARPNHYIRNARPVAPRRTVCIEVDSASHLFLAGRSMVPTHNSSLRSAYRSYYFLKRLQEIEGVGVERDLAGYPVLKVPSALLDTTADPNVVAVRNSYETFLKNVRRDEQEGVLLPSDRDENGNPFYEFNLISSGSSRAIKIDESINRYQRDIARSVLADFIFLGAQGGGSLALGQSKVQTFSLAIRSYMGHIAAQINEGLIPMIWRVNGLDDALRPRAQPGDIEPADLASLGQFIKTLSDVGYNLSGDRALGDLLRAKAELPPAPEDLETEDFAPMGGIEPMRPGQAVEDGDIYQNPDDAIPDDEGDDDGDGDGTMVEKARDWTAILEGFDGR